MRRVGLMLSGLAILAGVWAVTVRRSVVPGVRASARQEPEFDPVEVARIETAGWRAYYDRNFLDGFLLLIRLVRGQFHLGPLAGLKASYYAVRSQMAFAPKRNDHDAVRRYLTRFYAIAPRRDGVDPADLDEAELDYWVVHRRIVEDADKTPLIHSFARLHALIFGGTPETMRPSAEQRTLACNAVDRITGKTSTDPYHDWALVQQHLTAAYQLAVAVARSS